MTTINKTKQPIKKGNIILQRIFSLFSERVLVIIILISRSIIMFVFIGVLELSSMIRAMTKIGLITVKDVTIHISPVTIKTYPTTNLTLKSSISQS